MAVISVAQATYIVLNIPTDTSVTIGLQQSYYSVREDGGFLQVCVEILSGDTEGRTISLDYTTVDGTAEGKKRWSSSI